MMTNFLQYDLKVGALLALCYLFYRLLMERDTLHHLNRVTLLLSAVMALLLPLCTITVHQTIELTVPTITAAPVSSAVPVAKSATGGAPFDWLSLLGWMAVSGIAARLVFLGTTYWQLRRLINHSQRYTLSDGTRLAVIEGSYSPFAWMHTVVLSRSDYEAVDASLLAHEKAHVRLHHSYDIVFVELLTALQWFNPVVWLLRQDLRTLHEYEADAAVLSQGFDESQYVYLLMRKATGMKAFVSGLGGIGTSQTKRRIRMMIKKKSTRWCWLKGLYIVPIAALSLATTARTVTDYKFIQQPQQPQAATVDNAQQAAPPAGYVGVMVIDGKIATREDYKALLNHKEDIVAKHKMSPEEAQQLYGERGLNGAWVITTKNVTSNDEKVVCVVDGKEMTMKDLDEQLPKKEDIDHVDVLGSETARKIYGERASDGAIIITTKKSTAGQDDEPVLTVCDQLPQFPGGATEMTKWVMQNVVYPKKAIEAGAQATVQVGFVVEKDGTLTNAEIKKVTGAIGVVACIDELKQEALRLVNKMPRWIPGKQHGETVRVSVCFPVYFRLN